MSTTAPTPPPLTHRPDYNGGGIVNLMSSLRLAFGDSSGIYPPASLLPPSEVTAYAQVLLLVIDGLGFNYLREQGVGTRLQECLAGRLTSVFPPTTAAAITTYLTGEAPQQHGLTGWHMYFRELGSVLAVLPGHPRYGGVGLSRAGLEVSSFFGRVPLADRIEAQAYTIAPEFIAHSDFNRVHLGRAHLVTFASLRQLFQRATAIIRRRGGPKYLYAYWPQLDSLGHEQGMNGAAARRHLAQIDAELERFLDTIRGTGTLVLITADHGFIDTTAADRLSLADHPELAEMLQLPLCGEPRTAYCYLRPGREEAFRAYAADVLGQRAALWSSPELVEQGLFGLGAPHPRLLQRIGDYCLMMQDHYVLTDRLPGEAPFDLVGVHGGLSEDELYVPLVIARP